MARNRFASTQRNSRQNRQGPKKRLISSEVFEKKYYIETHLNHANLAIGHGDESLVDQLVGEFVSRVTFHNIGFCLLIS